MSDPILWYLNRSTGSVLLVIFTLAVVLGITATFGRAGRGVPRFLGQAFHRNVSLLGAVLLVGHIATAVVDTYVDIRWWQAVVPWGATYKPFWLSLGTIAFDLIVLITITSLLRTRMSHAPWRAIHLTAYAAWAISVLHGLGIGTDAGASWSRMLTIGCVVVVVVAVLVRLGAAAFGRRVEA